MTATLRVHEEILELRCHSGFAYRLHGYRVLQREADGQLYLFGLSGTPAVPGHVSAADDRGVLHHAA